MPPSHALDIPFWEEDYSQYYTPKRPFLLSKHPRDMGTTFSHTHIGFELFIVLSGEGRVLHSGSYFDIHPGDCSFADCMIPHGMEAATPMEIMLAHMRTPALLAVYPVQGDVRILQPFFALRKGASPILSNAASIAEFLHGAYECYTKKMLNWEILTWARIAAAFAEITRYASRAENERDDAMYQHMQVVHKAIQYMHNNLRNKITLKEIAEYCTLSVSRFSHIFTMTMHVSPIHYLNELRIHHAAEQILQTDEKLTAIAQDFGFSSFPPFFTLFKKTFGYAPSSLRKKNQGK